MPASQPAPIFLIHGAWAGAWVWDRLLPHLAAAGLVAHAVDLPGNGVDGTDPAEVTFDQYLDHLHRLIAPLGVPVSLVGHSGGGLSVSAFAERHPDLVARIAYVAGMMLPDGASFGDMVEGVGRTEPDAAGVNPHIVWSADGRVTQVPPAAAIAHFFQDCAPEDAQAAAARLCPQGEGGRAVVMRVSPARFGQVPRLYVEALEDQSVVLAVQRRMQSLVPGARVASLPTGHAPQLAAPDLLAAALIPFLKGA